MTTLQTIQFGDEGQAATRELVKRFDALRPQFPSPTQTAAAAVLDGLKTLESIDRQYGGTGPLPLEDADTLATATITQLAELDLEARRQGFEKATFDVAQMAVAVSLWAMRHEVAIRQPAIEHATSALALLSNEAFGNQEITAIFGIMRALIDHVRPLLGGDLERSDPQRPWRILHSNLAITAIRSGDPRLMEPAFDALDEALPDERGAFYAEALALAMNPKIPAQVREAIERRHKRWNPGQA